MTIAPSEAPLITHEELDAALNDVAARFARAVVGSAAILTGCPPERAEEVAEMALRAADTGSWRGWVFEAVASLAVVDEPRGRHTGDVPRLGAPDSTVVAVDFADTGPDLSWRGPETAPTAVGVAAVVSVPRDAVEEPAVEAAAAPAAEVGTRERAEPQGPVQAVTAIPHISEWTEPPTPEGEGGAA